MVSDLHVQSTGMLGYSVISQMRETEHSKATTLRHLCSQSLSGTFTRRLPNIFQQTDWLLHLHAGEITTLMQSSFLEVLGVLFFVWFVCRCSAR